MVFAGISRRTIEWMRPCVDSFHEPHVMESSNVSVSIGFARHSCAQQHTDTHKHCACLCVYVCVCVCRSEKRTVTLVAVDVIERTLREWVLSWWRSAGAQLDKQTAGQRNSRHTHTHTQRKKKRIKEQNQKSKINSTCWFELNTTINQSNGVHGVRLSAKWRHFNECLTCPFGRHQWSDSSSQP